MRFSLRTFLVVCLLVPLLIWCALGVVSVVKVILNPFAGFDGVSEFENYTGARAKRKLNDWPDGVVPSDVAQLSFKDEWSRDSFSYWYKIKLKPGAAIKWRDKIHKRQAASPRYDGDHYEGYQGVHYLIAGPPPQNWQTGSTPNWWKPPSIDFRATEVMIWQEDFYSGTGRGVYSAFDETTGELWIYGSACQHDLLWGHEEVPAGESFGDIDLSPR